MKAFCELPPDGAILTMLRPASRQMPFVLARGYAITVVAANSNLCASLSINNSNILNHTNTAVS